jgi:hypothetical protein
LHIGVFGVGDIFIDVIRSKVVLFGCSRGGCVILRVVMVRGGRIGGSKTKTTSCQ